MSKADGSINRRSFLAKSAALIAAKTALPSTALSYGRIAGANDRISLCHIGAGSRGSELAWIVAQLKTSHNVEMTAVCDLRQLNREKAVAKNIEYFGRAPRGFQYLEEALEVKDMTRGSVLPRTGAHCGRWRASDRSCRSLLFPW